MMTEEDTERCKKLCSGIENTRPVFGDIDSLIDYCRKFIADRKYQAAYIFNLVQEIKGDNAVIEMHETTIKEQQAEIESLKIGKV